MCGVYSQGVTYSNPLRPHRDIDSLSLPDWRPVTFSQGAILQRHRAQLCSAQGEDEHGRVHVANARKKRAAVHKKKKDPHK